MKRFSITCFGLLIVWVVQAFGLNFKQVAYFPEGSYFGGYIKGSDSNRDGYQELIFRGGRSTNAMMCIFGYRPYNRYLLEDASVWSSPWEVGFLDYDTLYDVVSQTVDSSYVPYIRVYEQTSPGSFPTTLVWSWRYEYIGGDIVSGMYITDLDRDGLREILTADLNIIYVFETRGDNQYVKVFSDTETLNINITPYFAVSDFDGDGQMEFAYGAYGGAPENKPTVFVRECTGDDQYQVVWTDTLLANNMLDVITCPDLDNDGKPEFLIGSYGLGVSGWTAGLWLYESTGNNQYDLIYADSITGLFGSDVICHSDCGDVDMDGKPELVWTINQDWMVYKSTGNNQFQRVFRAYRDRRHRTTKALIRDMNGNGYPEIIITGDDSARIGYAYGVTEVWEVEVCQVVYPNGGETLYGDSLAVIRWRNVTPFQADSFSLFYSSDSGLTYSPVAHGVPGSDSAYTWTVPRTFSDDCFVMLWAYQNATGWDFSDSHFRIRDGTGVEVFPPHASCLTPYVPCPNPFVSYASVPGHEKESFSLYDVSGRLVGSFKGDKIGAGLSAGIYFLKPEAQDAKPLRIVKLR